MVEAQDPQADIAHIWQVLREEGGAVAGQEPLLEPVLDQIVSAATSLPEALARRLASALADREMSEATYHGLFLECLYGDPPIVAAAARDLVSVHTRDPACRTHIQAFLNYKTFQAVQIHRVAHRLWKTGREELAAWLSNRVSVVLGPDIHPAAQLGEGIMLDHGAGIVIGETAVVEDDATILQNVTLGGTGNVIGDRHPKIGRGVMIGAGAKIIGNVEVGAFSKVGAGSVVLKDVPARCTVVGVPAQIVRRHSTTGGGDGSIALATRADIATVKKPALDRETKQ